MLQQNAKEEVRSTSIITGTRKLYITVEDGFSSVTANNRSEVYAYGVRHHMRVLKGKNVIK